MVAARDWPQRAASVSTAARSSGSSRMESAGPTNGRPPRFLLSVSDTSHLQIIEARNALAPQDLIGERVMLRAIAIASAPLAKRAKRAHAPDTEQGQQG